MHLCGKYLFLEGRDDIHSSVPRVKPGSGHTVGTPPMSAKSVKDWGLLGFSGQAPSLGRTDEEKRAFAPQRYK